MAKSAFGTELRGVCGLNSGITKKRPPIYKPKIKPESLRTMTTSATPAAVVFFKGVHGFRPGASYTETIHKK